MKAVVLVGGEGTRLRPLTETIPKPLVDFLDRPFLHRVLEHLAAYGVEEAILSSPYLESTFEPFLESRRGGGPALIWITEDEPLGTAGAIANARPHLDGPTFVLNGDILTDLDLGALAARHRETGAVATITLTRVEDARPYGLVATDGTRVLEFREKPEEAIPGDVNAGTYVLEPEALDGLPAGPLRAHRAGGVPAPDRGGPHACPRSPRTRTGWTSEPPSATCRPTPTSWRGAWAGSTCAAPSSPPRAQVHPGRAPGAATLVGSAPGGRRRRSWRTRSCSAGPRSGSAPACGARSWPRIRGRPRRCVVGRRARRGRRVGAGVVSEGARLGPTRPTARRSSFADS